MLVQNGDESRGIESVKKKHQEQIPADYGRKRKIRNLALTNKALHDINRGLFLHCLTLVQQLLSWKYHKFPKTTLTLLL